MTTTYSTITVTFWIFQNNLSASKTDTYRQEGTLVCKRNMLSLRENLVIYFYVDTLIRNLHFNIIIIIIQDISMKLIVFLSPVHHDIDIV